MLFILKIRSMSHRGSDLENPLNYARILLPLMVPEDCVSKLIYFDTGNNDNTIVALSLSVSLLLSFSLLLLLSSVSFHYDNE